MTFRIVGAEPEEADVQPSPWQFWLGRHQGELIGVLTNPPAVLQGGYFPVHDQAVHLHHVSGIQMVLIDERVQPITGLDPRDVVDTVFPEVGNASFGRATVAVDGDLVEAETLTYRGLDFIFGRDLRRYPFVVVKEAGSGTWPALSVLPDD